MWRGGRIHWPNRYIWLSFLLYGWAGYPLIVIIKSLINIRLQKIGNVLSSFSGTNFTASVGVLLARKISRVMRSDS